MGRVCKVFLWMSRTAECVFLAQNEAGGLLQSDEIQSESVHMLSVENIQRMLKKIFKEYSVRECTSAVSGEYSKNGAKLRKGRGSWKIDRFLNCQLSNFKPCTWRKDHNPTIPPY